jgi:hypothetical protein
MSSTKLLTQGEYIIPETKAVIQQVSEWITSNWPDPMRKALFNHMSVWTSFIIYAAQSGMKVDLEEVKVHFNKLGKRSVTAEEAVSDLQDDIAAIVDNKAPF